MSPGALRGHPPHTVQAACLTRYKALLRRAMGRPRCWLSGPKEWSVLRLGVGRRERYDPKVLLTYVAEALNAVQPVGERVFDALASPASSVPGSVVPLAMAHHEWDPAEELAGQARTVLYQAGIEDSYATPPGLRRAGTSRWADTAEARTLMREIDGILKRQSDLGTLVRTLRDCGSG
jgi:hypothetical protein